MLASIWTNFFHGLSVEEKLAAVKKIGFSVAEIAFEDIIDPGSGDLSEAHVSELFRIASHLQLQTPQVHYPITTLRKGAQPPYGHGHASTDLASLDPDQRAFDLASAERLLRLCPLAGIQIMVIHPGGMYGWKDPGEFETLRMLNRASFERLAAVAEEVRVKIAVENMGRAGDGRAFGSHFEEILSLIEEVGSPSVGVCLDTSHANLMGLDIPKAIRVCGSRLIATHMSDNFGERDDHLTPYEGKIPWESVLSALREVGYSGAFNLEIPGENRCPLPVRLLKGRYARDLLEWMLEGSRSSFETRAQSS